MPFKLLLNQHLQPSQLFFGSCGSRPRNNNLLTTIRAGKKESFRWVSRLASLDSGSKFGRFELTPLAESLLREVWGRLALDENDTVIFLPIPAGRLTEGANTLTISQTGQVPDDIRIGEIILDQRPVNEVLSEVAVDIRVSDESLKDRQDPLPCKITVVNARGALVTVGASSGKQLAVRPGVLYTATGHVHFGQRVDLASDYHHARDGKQEPQG